MKQLQSHMSSLRNRVKDLKKRGYQTPAHRRRILVHEDPATKALIAKLPKKEKIEAENLFLADADAINHAAYRLGFLKSEASANLLRHLITVKSRWVKLGALWNLSYIGKPKDLPLMSRLMYDKDPIVLNGSGVQGVSYTSALKVVNGLNSESLIALSNGDVFIYDNLQDKMYYFNSQPTPVQMTLTNNISGANMEARYKLDGTGSSANLTMDWKMTSSTIGNANCYDFQNQDKKSFADTKAANGDNRIAWDNAKRGTITLSTVFLTPKNSTDTQRITPKNSQTSILGYSGLMNADTIMLNNYDSQGISDYDTLKGLFDRIENGEMCLSKDSSEIMKIWWNQEYLDSLAEEIGSGSGSSC